MFSSRPTNYQSMLERSQLTLFTPSTNASTRDLIFKIFLTQKYKRITYPNRPLFTLTYVLAILGLIAANIVALGWVVGVILATAFDDLAMYPLMRLIQSAENLMNKRKIGKAIFTLIGVTLGLIAGTLLGFFVLPGLPLVVTSLAMYTTVFGSSLVTTAACITVGMLGARALHKPALLGVLIGALVASLIPLAVPVIVDTVFLGVTASGFLASFICEGVSGAYYFNKYGDSNADGYKQNFSATELQARDERQAAFLGVSLNEFQKLLKFCRDSIRLVKQKSYFTEELLDIRRQGSNSFKDIYHLLIEAKDLDDKNRLQELLTVSVQLKKSLNLEFDTEEKATIESDYIEDAEPELQELRLHETYYAFIHNIDLHSTYRDHRERLKLGFFKISPGDTGYEENRFELAAEPFLVENNFRLSAARL